MNPAASYTPHHPKWYRRPVSGWWWLQKRIYTKFVLRELSSVSVAFFSLLLLWKVRAVGQGPEAYAAFLAWMRTPFFLVLNAVAFVWVLFHSITWFNLAPKAMVIRLGGQRVPDWAIQLGNYLAWGVVTAVALWVLQRG